MPFIKTNDEVEIFVKDWGSKDAQPIVFHHGWPLSSDDWDAQMLFFLKGMGGAANAHYEGFKAFSETDQTNDLKAITVPALVIQGDDDQVVPHKDAALLQAKLIENSTLKIYHGYSHGMLTINADVIDEDILAFIKG